MRIYLDNCCFNRPYDNQGNLKVELETKAKLRIQEMIVNNELELVISYILEYENDDNPYPERKIFIADFFRYAILNIEATEDIIAIAKAARESGLKVKDSLHVACAIVADCDYLLTTDKRLLKHKDSRVNIVNPMEFILDMEEF